MRIAVFRDLPADERRLTPGERRQADRLGLSGSRRRDFVRGRAALTRVLGAGRASVLSASDGAPVSCAAALSISHDGDHVAVAVASRGRRVGVDVCLRAHEHRLLAIVNRLLGSAHGDPVATWAALECVLKLRRRPVTALLGARLGIVRDGAVLRVTGLGAPARVRVRDDGDRVVAWGIE